MGHEFTGYIEALGEDTQRRFDDLKIGERVTVNPLISCGQCDYCLSGRQQICPKRQLLSASLPGSNAQYVTVRADALFPIPEDLPLTIGSLTEPAAFAVHTARQIAPQPDEIGLVVGAGPIGLFIIQALIDRGLTTIYCADLNDERLAMAVSLGAIAVQLTDEFRGQVDIAVDAVGAAATRQACIAATRSGGRVVWVGLHERESALDINDMIRREITAYGSFAYTPLDFQNALKALHQKRLGLDETWTRVEPLGNGTACFEELLGGSAVAKIWLTPE
jgi:threonine dehydrogenase-like Zn-dependent dehydrogenase